MNADEINLIILFVAACAACGLLVTRYWRKQKDARFVRERLTSLIGELPAQDRPILLEDESPAWLQSGPEPMQIVQKLSKMIELSGRRISIAQLINTTVVLLLVPALLLFVIDPSLMWIGVPVGVVLAVIPFVFIKVSADQRRTKFVQQLPDAIELMISVLRSGLSIPQSVKAISEEFPAPCGPEFTDVLHRMNLGQSLPDSLGAAAERYQVFELDLIRRAAAIQMEVGGSLADLLEKTNGTLKQRLQLKRKISVHTAQSRMSTYVIAVMPFVMALVFKIINPGYLDPLVTTNVGRVMVVLALISQFIGVFVIKKMATFKV